MNMYRKVNPATAFWNSIISAVEAEPQDARYIQGASGIQHPVISLGFDSLRNRLIAISIEHDARAAALMQADLQSAFEATRVIVARPITIGLDKLARILSSENEEHKATRLKENDDWTRKTGFVPRTVAVANDESVKEYIATYALSFQEQVSQKVIPEDLIGYWKRMQAAQLSWQFSQINWEFTVPQPKITSISIMSDSSPDEFTGEEYEDKVSRLLGNLFDVDPIEQDRKMGVCAVPLYEFASSEFELLHSGTSLDDIKAVLLRHDLLQYFFPAPDQLTLGMVERGKLNSVANLMEHLAQAPKLGHPFGATEILPASHTLTDVIEELQHRKLIIEGEFGLELTKEGRATRSTVRFKSREGLLSKILNRMSVSLNLKDLFPGGGA